VGDGIVISDAAQADGDLPAVGRYVKNGRIMPFDGRPGGRILIGNGSIARILSPVIEATCLLLIGWR